MFPEKRIHLTMIQVPREQCAFLGSGASTNYTAILTRARARYVRDRSRVWPVQYGALHLYCGDRGVLRRRVEDDWAAA